MKIQQLYAEVTAAIIKDLEAGVALWTKPWKWPADVQSIGQKKYPHSRPFEMYGIGKPLTKFISKIELVDGVAIERRVEQNV